MLATFNCFVPVCSLHGLLLPATYSGALGFPAYLLTTLAPALAFFVRLRIGLRGSWPLILLMVINGDLQHWYPIQHWPYALVCVLASSLSPSTPLFLLLAASAQLVVGDGPPQLLRHHPVFSSVPCAHHPAVLWPWLVRVRTSAMLSSSGTGLVAYFRMFRFVLFCATSKDAGVLNPLLLLEPFVYVRLLPPGYLPVLARLLKLVFYVSLVGQGSPLPFPFYPLRLCR